MKKYLINLFSIAVLSITHVHGEFLDLATMPLQTSGSSDVKPNLMFVLDNSGSMAWDYAPDWANSTSDWLFANSDYNTQYYDPEVQYTPPLTYQGAVMSSQTNFRAVANEVGESGNVKNGTTDLRSSAFYYAFVPGEYCSTPNLTSCVVSRVPKGIYIYPADIRWCNPGTNAATTRSLSGSMRCQKIRNSFATVNDSNTYTELRRPRATYELTLNKTSNSASVQSIKINNIELLSGSVTVDWWQTSNNLASAVRSAMCTSSSVTGNCKLAGNIVDIIGTGNQLRIRTFAGDPVNTASPIQVVMSGGNFSAQTATNLTEDIPGSMVYVSINSGITSYTAPGLNVKGADRSDCVGATCNYTEEMTNYANWWTYYRTRLQSMKTAASQAFKALDSRYRVGFMTINAPGDNYLQIAPFNSEQKQNWYRLLFAANANGGTPLREALSVIGRHYAGKSTALGSRDPMEYACQSNFTLLTTDGYWNGNAGLDINARSIGNLDGGSTPRPQFDSSNRSGTLADVAKYYYDTDIRDGRFSNCNGALGSSVCGTADDYPKQNMVTLTLGLGIDGTLVYTENYKSQAIGDYKDISNGNKNWPDPGVREDGTRIDDLWHAAVNAGGTYYSASNPKLLRESLAKGLSEIKSIQGASAAAAASSLAPTNGDNFQYVASYQTVKWIGNLEARTVNVSTLETSQSAVWCIENIAANACPSPATEVRISGNGSTNLYCKTSSSDQTKCDTAGGVLGAVLGTNEPASCYVQTSASCTGRLQTQVANNTRKIYFNSGNALALFTGDALPAQHRTALSNGYLALSQMQGLPSTDPKITDANKVNKLVDYLRGNKTYEDTSLNSVAENKLFRERQATLGDISQSRPNYFKTSNAGYLDSNYKAYKTSMANRTPAVYVGANDGMLHAFNANTGDELWAFIPTPAISNLANLADKEYGANYHTNYVNGSPVVADICISGCSGSSAVWRTILVSGLNGGGRGYFAIDVTSPENPQLLWEFYAQPSGVNSNLGFTFGNPVVTKMQDGRWVVVFTSGYNNGDHAARLSDGTLRANSPKGDGRGYLYVRDAYSGSEVKTLTTGEGSASSPSGLSRISSYAEQMFENNTAINLYGGDLNGNVWRFNINTGAVTKIATLSIGTEAQKITTQPELGKVDKNMVLMIGTGKFLEPADLTNMPVNSVYVMKDGGQTSPISRAQSNAFTAVTLNSDRVVSSSKTPDFTTGYGWYVDFPAGERVNLDPLLLNGVLMVPTLVPSSAACNGTGYGWINYFNYKKGTSFLPSGLVSERTTTPIVGYNILYDSKGVPRVVITGSNDPTPQQSELSKMIFGPQSSGQASEIFKQKANGSYGTKQSWHELIQ
jgi:type IV pilus assembly protein PilY1